MDNKVQPAQEIEALIDKHGLAAVLGAVVTVCCDKAEHLIVNWQDREAADRWDNAAKDVFAAKMKARDLRL